MVELKIQFGHSNEKSFSTQIVDKEELTKTFVSDLMDKYDWITIIDNNGDYVTEEYCERG